MDLTLQNLEILHSSIRANVSSLTENLKYERERRFNGSNTISADKSELLNEMEVALHQSEELLEQLDRLIATFRKQELDPSIAWSEEEILLLKFFEFSIPEQQQQQPTLNAAAIDKIMNLETEQKSPKHDSFDINTVLKESEKFLHPNEFHDSMEEKRKEKILQEQFEQYSDDEIESVPIRQVSSPKPTPKDSENEKIIKQNLFEKELEIQKLKEEILRIKTDLELKQTAEYENNLKTVSSKLKEQTNEWKDILEQMRLEASSIQGQLKESFKLERSKLIEDLASAKAEIESLKHKIFEQDSNLQQYLVNLENASEEKQKILLDKQSLQKEVEELIQQKKDTKLYNDALKTKYLSTLYSKIENLQLLMEKSSQDRALFLNLERQDTEQYREMLESLIKKENNLLRGIIEQMKDEMQNRKGLLDDEIMKLKTLVSNSTEHSIISEADLILKKNLEKQVMTLEVESTKRHFYKASDPNDPLDVAVADVLNSIQCPVLIEIERVAVGEYLIDRRLKLRVVNGDVVIRIGANYELFSNYLRNLYAPFFVDETNRLDSSIDKLSVLFLQFFKNTYLILKNVKFASKFIQPSNSPSKENPQQIQETKKSQPEEFKAVLQPKPKEEVSPRPASVPPKIVEKTVSKPTIPELKIPTKTTITSSASKNRGYATNKPTRPSTATNASHKNLTNMAIPTPTVTAVDTKTPKSGTFYEKVLRSTGKSLHSTAPTTTTTSSSSVEYNNKNTNPSVTLITISPSKTTSSTTVSTNQTPVADKIIVPDTLDDSQIRQLKKLALKKQIEDMRSKKK